MTDHQPLSPETIAQARAVDVTGLAKAYGFSGKPSGLELVGPCPGCGGRDRFSVSRAKNIWRCRQGGGDPVGGDAIALVSHVEGKGFRDAVEMLAGGADILPRNPKPATEADADHFREKERRRAFELWREGRPFDRGGFVVGYLKLRAIDPAWARFPGAHCREHRDFPFWHFFRDRPEAERKWRVIHRGPAMLWPITGLDGHFMGLHATWIDLSTDTGKAEIFCPETGEQLPAKKVRGLKKGGRIVLRAMPDGHDEGAVGEGVETVLSWADLRRFAGALWSSVDLGNLAGRAARTVAHPTLKITRRDGRKMPVRVPGPEPRADDDQAELFSPDPGTARLTMLADGDSDPIATRAAMLRAEARFATRDFEAVTDWSAPLGHDFNSLLMEGRNAAA